MLIDERISRWTPEQAEAVAHFLHPDAPPATEIAERLGITPQAVSYRLRGAGAKTLRKVLETLEARKMLYRIFSLMELWPQSAQAKGQ